jgi:hypothetical protein
MKTKIILAGLLAVLPPARVGSGQELSLDSLLEAHSYDLSIEGDRLMGPGLELILAAARDAQFVAIAEEHNLRELNQLSSRLFEELQRAYGFDYVALEQGSVIASWFGAPGRRGDIEAIAELAGRYPHAPTFATDEELEMIAAVGGLSTASVNPIWGVDQELGALHILEALARLAPTDDARRRVEELAEEARRYELDRAGETHYLAEVAAPEDFRDLPALFRAEAGSEAALLIDALIRTSRIYYNYTLSRQGLPTAYENGREREESMKLRFMELYRRAQSAGDTLPRVLAKLGHWHLFRGIYRANVTTFGNFLSEFALANGMAIFLLSTYVVESPETWRNAGGPLADVAGQAQFTVVDLRPLRPYAHQNMIAGLSEGFRRRLFQVDAALIIRGGRTGGYSIVRGEPSR